MEGIETDIAIVGGGMAGLAAFDRLRLAGRDVVLLEARERLGGRIFTLHPEGWPLPVELGAEFIHGSPPELLDQLHAIGCRTDELDAFSARANWNWRDGELLPAGEFSGGDVIFDRLQKIDLRDGDVSFLEFLNAACADVPASARSSALNFIEGFEAADPARIGVRSLQREFAAEEALGSGQHRVVGGYDQLLRLFPTDRGVLTNTVVRAIAWRRDEVRIEALRQGEPLQVCTRRALMTLPLGVLHGGEVRFDPPLAAKSGALAQLAMGNARRVVLRLRQPIWERLRDSAGNSLKRLRFLFSQDTPTGHFPTWWTNGATTDGEAQIVGWAASRHADAMRSRSDEEVCERAVEDLGMRLRLTPAALREEIVVNHTYDWTADPFARGAYSYVLKGGTGAQAELARPLDQTLFFAGEATESEGHHATVYGAIRSGWRAAKEIVAPSPIRRI